MSEIKFSRKNDTKEEKVVAGKIPFTFDIQTDNHKIKLSGYISYIEKDDKKQVESIHFYHPAGKDYYGDFVTDNSNDVLEGAYEILEEIFLNYKNGTSIDNEITDEDSDMIVDSIQKVLDKEDIEY